MLTFLSPEVIFYQPLPDKFLGKLLLRFTCLLPFDVTFLIKIARRIGRMYFINQVDGAVVLPEFIFRIDQDKAVAGRRRATTSRRSIS